MKNIIIFLSFILYSSFIFFINNNIFLIGILLFNILAMACFRVNLRDALRNLCKILPFILLTVVINLVLSTYEYAIIVDIKLILVCNITYTYSRTTTVKGVANTVKVLCMPLKLFKINPEEIELLVCIALSMIPILRREFNQLKDACIAKGIDVNVQNMKIILTKFMGSLMKRVNEIEEAVMEKGYGEI